MEKEEEKGVNKVVIEDRKDRMRRERIKQMERRRSKRKVRR